MKVKALILTFSLCSTTGAFGAITITPASPTSSDMITIRVETAFGALAHVTSAALVQVGSTFVIQQDVDAACSLPTSSLLVSEFQVGPLPAGPYNVTATTTITGVVPPCNPPPIIQTAPFTVASLVPALDARALVLLAFALAVSALVLLRR